MDNLKRLSIYKRDRSTLTPKQERRLRKHDNDEKALFNRRLRRKSHKQLKRMETKRRNTIRARFAMWRR